MWDEALVALHPTFVFRAGVDRESEPRALRHAPSLIHLRLA